MFRLRSVAAFVLYFLAAQTAASQTSIRAAYPLPGATDVSAHTGIGIRYPRPLDRSALAGATLSIRDAHGHSYPASAKLSSDAQTLIITPTDPLPYGMSISATVGPLPYAVSGTAESYTTSFTTQSAEVPAEIAYSGDDPITQLALRARANGYLPDMTSGAISRPQSFPLLTVVNDDDPSDGRLYMANFKFALSQKETFRMVLDRQGSVLYSQSSNSSVILDFKPHPNGRYTYFDSPTSTFVVLDSNLSTIETLSAANGNDMDGHEFIYNADGSYYTITLHYFKKDMRAVFPGADSNATVIDDVVQEFDKDHNLIWEWRGLDHYQFTDIQNESLSGQTVDYCHMNAIEIDTDGNLLLSCRHMDEITKVDRQTGDIIWRWGGKNNQFTFLFDTTGFSHQHAIRYVPTGTYTLFDNGNYHQHGATFSRAVEYKLDQVNKTAKQVWEFRHNPLTYGYAMGYVQRLPNGNTLIGWGACANVAVTEVGPFNRVVFEMAMDSGNYSYRAFKYPAEYLRAGVTKTEEVASASALHCVTNPAASMTDLRFSIAHAGQTEVAIFDLLGRRVSTVANEYLTEGSYTATADVHALAPGSYRVVLRSESGTESANLLVLH